MYLYTHLKVLLFICLFVILNSIADGKTSLSCNCTMQVSANEIIEPLERAGKTTPLEVHCLKNPESKHQQR